MRPAACAPNNNLMAKKGKLTDMQTSALFTQTYLAVRETFQYAPYVAATRNAIKVSVKKVTHGR